MLDRTASRPEAWFAAGGEIVNAGPFALAVSAVNTSRPKAWDRESMQISLRRSLSFGDNNRSGPSSKNINRPHECPSPTPWPELAWSGPRCVRSLKWVFALLMERTLLELP
jgi:hypothetical protein